MFRKWMAIIWAAGVVSACAPGPLPTPDPTLLALSVNMRVTELALQTRMAYISPTPSLTPAPTATQTQTTAPSATAFAVDFTGNEIYTAFLAEGQTQVSIIVPGGIEGDFTALINNKEFSCFSYVMKTIPRLICLGPSLPRGTIVEMKIFPKDSRTPIFERQFATPE